MRDGKCDQTYHRSIRFRRYESAIDHAPNTFLQGSRAVLGGRETTPPLRSANAYRCPCRPSVHLSVQSERRSHYAFDSDGHVNGVGPISKKYSLLA